MVLDFLAPGIGTGFRLENHAGSPSESQRSTIGLRVKVGRIGASTTRFLCPYWVAQLGIVYDSKSP